VPNGDRDWFRGNSYSSETVLLDGISGTGKTMAMRIIGSFTGVIPPRFNYQLEQICIAIYEGKLETNAGIEILQLILDQNHYDAALSRELNFRPKDLSSILGSPKRLEYLKRLFLPDGENAWTRLQAKQEKLFLIVHQLMSASDILDNLPEKKIHRILCTRHPYYLFDHWVSCVDMHGSTPRDFSVTLGGSLEVPWFVQSNFEMFTGGSPENKAAKVISDLMKSQESFLENHSNVLIIDFEKFVLEPANYVERMEMMVGGSPQKLASILKRENLPRMHINLSNQKKIYKRYSSNKLNSDFNHAEDYEILRDRILSSTSDEHFNLLESAASTYEARFGRWF